MLFPFSAIMWNICIKRRQINAVLLRDSQMDFMHIAHEQIYIRSFFFFFSSSSLCSSSSSFILLCLYHFSTMTKLKQNYGMSILWAAAAAVYYHNAKVSLSSIRHRRTLVHCTLHSAILLFIYIVFIALERWLPLQHTMYFNSLLFYYYFFTGTVHWTSIKENRKMIMMMIELMQSCELVCTVHQYWCILHSTYICIEA